MKNQWKSKKNPWNNPWKIDQNSKKNRPKSSLGVCWALLGHLGVPYWRPWASWEHLGSVFGASWSVLGASRWHPGTRRRPHIDRFLDAILIRKWSQNGSPNLPKTIPKKCSIFRSLFHRFLVRSWEPKSLKMGTSCTREAHFHKIAFSPILTYFWKQKWWKKAS